MHPTRNTTDQRFTYLQDGPRALHLTCATDLTLWACLIDIYPGQAYGPFTCAQCGHRM